MDPHTLLHTETPPPPTYIRGNSRLDFFFISKSLLHSVERAGILPYNSVFEGNHRPCYLDFSAQSLFQDTEYPISPLTRRGLQLLDLRKVKKYVATFENQTSYHKILEKLEVLFTSAGNASWSSDQTKQYTALDRIITESMIHAERSATKVVSKRYDWSPELVQAIHALRFWDLTRKRSIGLKIGDTTLQSEALKGGINLDEVSSPITYTSIMKYRSQARSTLRECQ